MKRNALSMVPSFEGVRLGWFIGVVAVSVVTFGAIALAAQPRNDLPPLPPPPPPPPDGAPGNVAPTPGSMAHVEIDVIANVACSEPTVPCPKALFYYDVGCIDTSGAYFAALRAWASAVNASLPMPYRANIYQSRC